MATLASVVGPLVFAAPAAGTTGVGGCTASANQPALEVRTIPAMPGFRFTFDGQPYQVGPTGSVSIDASGTCDVLAALDPDRRPIPLGEGQRAIFARWYGGSSGVVTATFDVDYLVKFTFVDGQGTNHLRSELDTLTLRSSTGELLKLPREDQAWLRGSRVVPLTGELVQKPVSWSVTAVEVYGSNVVNESQRRFEPAQEPAVEIPVLFFDATVEATDAIFGSHVDGNLLLVYPDGSERRFRLGEGATPLPRLPRGEYELVVEASGLKLAQPVTMSRDQYLEVDVLTYLDLAVAGIFVGTLTLGLLIVGSRRRRRDRAEAAGCGRHLRRHADLGAPDRGEQAPSSRPLGGGGQPP